MSLKFWKKVIKVTELLNKENLFENTFKLLSKALNRKTYNEEKVKYIVFYVMKVIPKHKYLLSEKKLLF